MTFMSTDPDWKMKLFVGGLLFFPFPPIGWLFALGFRSVTGSRLIEGDEPILASWKESPSRMFVRGIGASGVILTYFVPFLLTYWVFMPAVFVQVALKGGYHGAFNLFGALNFITENLSTYIEAWALSVFVSCVALAMGPLAPWGIVWSYLVILYTFNEALSRWHTQEVQVRFRRSLLLRPMSFSG